MKVWFSQSSVWHPAAAPNANFQNQHVPINKITIYIYIYTSGPQSCNLQPSVDYRGLDCQNTLDSWNSLPCVAEISVNLLLHSQLGPPLTWMALRFMKIDFGSGNRAWHWQELAGGNSPHGISYSVETQPFRIPLECLALAAAVGSQPQFRENIIDMYHIYIYTYYV